MRGAKGFRKRYPSAKEKPVLCLDCVGSGDELLILPGKGARWNGELLDAINSSFENSERKTCYDKVDGLVHFPGDQRPSSRASRSARCAASPASGVSSARRGRITASTMKI
ncbi:MAG: hypothetical protein ACLS8S_04380 [Oscillospiraceae bacterium]